MPTNKKAGESGACPGAMPASEALEAQEELLWCSDLEFDARVDHLSVPAVLDLVQALQEAMAVEQQTFDSLRQQLACASNEAAVQERLSTALCSSQARLARLCARNMRCFMQAMRAKQSTPVQGLSGCAVEEVGAGKKSGEHHGEHGECGLTVMGRRLGGSEDDTGTEEGEEEEEEEEGSEEGSGSSGFHSLPRPPRKPVANTTTAAGTVARPHDEDKQQQQQQRVPSVDEILCSVKRLRTNHTAMVKSALKTCPSPTAVDAANTTFLHGHVASRGAIDTKGRDDEDSDSPLYENIVLNGAVTTPSGLIYENLNPSSETHIYDKPRFPADSVIEEDDDDIEAVYENINFSTGKKSCDTDLSDDSTVYENIEPLSKKKSIVNDEVTYDVPWNTRPIYASVTASAKKCNNNNNNKSAKNSLDINSLLPQSTRMLLNGSHQVATKSSPDQNGTKDVDQDSLEDLTADGSQSTPESEHDSEPDIPSPDYGSEGEDEDDDEFQRGEYCSDEGLGEPDARTYYTEDQGLAVILEEPEDEEDRSSSSAGSDCTSSSCASWPAAAACDTLRPSAPIQANHETVAGVETEGAEGAAKSQVVVDSARVSSAATSSSQQDRQLDEYHETLRQRNQRTVAATGRATDGTRGGQELQQQQNGSTATGGGGEDRLPSVRDLRSHFEVPTTSSTKAAAMLRVERVPSNGSVAKNSSSSSIEQPLQSEGSDVEQSVSIAASTSSRDDDVVDVTDDVCEREAVAVNVSDDEADFVEPILAQFPELNEEEEMRKPRPTTRSWDPSALLRRLYTLPEPFKSTSPSTPCVTIEGHLEKLPSGKKKATFWNAWKRRYFRAKDGFLYYYQNSQSERPSMTMQLMGGKVDSLESTILGIEDRQPIVSTMLGIDDGKGHYVVVRCTTKQETERWRLALMTHIVENFSATYIQPWPIPKDPALIKDTIIIDLGSCSVRAGVLCTQPSLPQLFFPTIMAVDKITKKRIYGIEALRPDVRSSSTIHYPVRPSAKITKYSVDLNAVSGFLQKVFQDLNVDQKLYDVILSVPRSFNATTQTEILNILFDQFGVRAVNMTHQSVLALYAYNATSGIVVDVGERMDIVPINDGYIVENGVSRIPYGGAQIVDHLRHFLLQKQYSLVTEVESFLIRYILENVCFCAQQYNNELNKFRQDPSRIEQSISIKEFFDDPNTHWETVTLDSGRFQPTEGLFNPEAWGLDNPGVHKMVHKAIQECSMDVRKEMTRSIYLSGGVTMLPGFAERLHAEIDKVTPSALVPKVHASPYRYHAAYLGACVLANSPGVEQMKVTEAEWCKSGSNALKKWTL